MTDRSIAAAVFAFCTATAAAADAPPQPEAVGPGWQPLFAADLANADKPANV